MHPVIAQAIAADQTRELQASAVAAGRARQIRRSRHALRYPRVPGAGRSPALRSAAQPLRRPKAA
jgi:hypothetical protein